MWVRNIDNYGGGAEFLKKERFIARLFSTLKVKVEVGAPNTYQETEASIIKKYRKLKLLQGEPPIESPKPRETSTSRELPELTVEILDKLNESLTNLSIHLAQVVGPKSQTKKAEE